MVEVIYINQDQQTCITVTDAVGLTVEQVIIKSGILKQQPDIDLAKNKVGIFSKQVALDHIVKAGDRIEIYRPLLIDPKQARRQRASSD